MYLNLTGENFTHVLMWSVQINRRQWMVETTLFSCANNNRSVVVALLLISYSLVADLKQAHSLMEKSQI